MGVGCDEHSSFGPFGPVFGRSRTSYIEEAFLPLVYMTASHCHWSLIEGSMVSLRHHRKSPLLLSKGAGIVVTSLPKYGHI